MINPKKLADSTECKRNWFAQCLSGGRTRKQVDICSKGSFKVKCSMFRKPRRLMLFSITQDTPGAF